jgi:virginiamycin A acetyltransferase
LIPCKIGGDVWIGARAVILGGVKIGHGAVIGAGAIVTKDIPPHAIAVGVPAKVVRYRFAQSLSEAIIQSQWWEAPEDVLRQMAPLADKPEEFLANLARIWVCDDTQSITGNT